MKNVSVSIGIFAHNEESNIEKTLESVLSQKTEIAKIKEILVISSGSSDKTNAIVRNYCKKYKKVKLLEELKRKGKSSAVNLFIRKSKAQILTAISADLQLSKNAIEEITLPFLQNKVGMVGAHPKPKEVNKSQVGNEVKLLWKLHHVISLVKPKCGEMVAFRKVIRSIPKESAVDEASIEVLLKLIGYEIVYAPRAIVYNKAPKTIKDFLTQRRRIFAGHIWINEKYNYKVSTMDINNDLEAVFSYFIKNPKDIMSLVKLIFLEIFGRILGFFDYHILGKNPYIWKMVKR